MSFNQDLIKIINEILFEAKLIHNEYFGKKGIILEGKFGGDTKGDAVTIADYNTEKKMQELYAKFLPGYNFLGEETGKMAIDVKTDKFTINDPLDGTWNYQRGIKNYGTITAICQEKTVIAAGISNTPKEQTFIGTFGGKWIINMGRARYSRPEPQIYIGQGPNDDLEVLNELTALVKEQWPGIKLAHDGAAINSAEVFSGNWPVFFHTGLAQHDISPVSLFSALTSVKATNHRNISYLEIDPAAEIAKYKAERQEVLYHNPILVAAAKEHDQMLRILERFHSFLDEKQAVGWNFVKDCNL